MDDTPYVANVCLFVFFLGGVKKNATQLVDVFLDMFVDDWGMPAALGTSCHSGMAKECWMRRSKKYIARLKVMEAAPASKIRNQTSTKRISASNGKQAVAQARGVK